MRKIQIDPGMVMPARATKTIPLRANLNAGRHIDQMQDVAALDSTAQTAADGVVAIYDSRGVLTQVGEDLGVLFNDDGDAFALNENQGIWLSYKTAAIRHETVVTNEVSTIGINGEKVSFSNNSAITGVSSIVAAQNAINSLRDKTGVNAYVDAGQLRIENRNQMDGGEKVKNIRITSGGTGVLQNFVQGEEDITAFRYRYTKSEDADSTTGQFRTTEDLRALIQYDANMIKNPEKTYYESTATVGVTINRWGMFEIANHDDADDEQRNLSLYVTSHFSDNVTNNVLFKETMKALNTASLIEGGAAVNTGKIVKATHATGEDIGERVVSKQ